MQALETLRRHIENVQDMQSVVTTMKTLAAVSIRQYEAAVAALVDYDRTMQLAFQILFRFHQAPLSPIVEDSRAADEIVERNIGQLVVLYNARTSAASYRPHRLQILPISRQEMTRWRREPWQSQSLPFYTMSWRNLFSAVIRQYLFVTLFQACAESLASENASRIASMQAAEKNIEERLAELQTRYNQQRQTSITEELLDVVTGFEALAKTHRHGK